MKLTALVLSALLALPATGHAQQLLESYVAFLSTNDHYNSKGARLTEPYQIIRQDRANFHRFNERDDGDEWDSFFSSMSNRANAEQMLLNGTISRQLTNKIVNSEVMIRVDIYGSGTTGRSLRVTVY